MVAAYTPTYYDEAVGLPAPEGIYGKEVHSTKTGAAQVIEARLLLDLIQTQDPIQYAKLTDTSAPMPVLMKVPGQSKVRMLLGLAPYVGDPFVQANSPLDGKFLALKEDIDELGEAPPVITLSDTVLTMLEVMAPTTAQFLERMVKNDDRNDGAPWFKQAKVNTTKVAVAHICPIPAMFAYDALMDAIPAHVLWERIMCADLQENEELRTYILNFLQAVHTEHNASNLLTLDLGATNPFMARQHTDAKQWAKEKAAKIFATVRVAGTVAAALPTSPVRAAAPPQDFQKIAEAMMALQAVGNQRSTTGGPALVVDTEKQMFVKYGLCSLDMTRMLTMCGLKTGQEDQLPAWITTVAMKDLSTDGKRAAVRAALVADPKYDENPIPVTPQLLKIIVNKEFTGDDDTTTAAGAMKGLSIYLMEDMTDEEIEEANAFASALEEAKMATVSEIRKRASRKATSPLDFRSLLDRQKTYANLLLALFGRKCPLLQELVRDMVVPLQKLVRSSRSLMRTTTIAAINWAVFRQGCSFALGEMHENGGDRTPEWCTACASIRAHQDFDFLTIPLQLKGRNIYIHDGWGPSKPDNGSNKRKQGQEAADKPAKAADGSPKKQKSDRYDGSKIPVHAVIKSKITAALPDKFQMKELAKVCGITDLKNIFPEAPKLCLHGAFRGHCPFHERCNLDHDNSVITDKMAETAINMLEPFIKDPTILGKGK